MTSPMFRCRCMNGETSPPPSNLVVITRSVVEVTESLRVYWRHWRSPSCSGTRTETNWPALATETGVSSAGTKRKVTEPVPAASLDTSFQSVQILSLACCA